MKLQIFLTLLFAYLSVYAQEQQFLYKARKIQATPNIILEPGEILVEGSRIVAIGKSLSRPKNCQLIDWQGYEIFPGLISPGSSLGLAEINALRPTRDENEVGSHTPEIEAWTAVNPDSELIPVARANGITHSLTVPMGGTISGISGVISLEGWGIEEMTIKKKVALHIWWPGQGLSIHTHNKSSKSMDEQVKDRMKSIRDMEEFFNQADAHLKARNNAQDRKSPLNPSWEAMIPFITGKLPIIVHADETRQISSAVEWAKKRKFKIILSGGRDAWKIADVLAKQKIPVIFRHIFTAPVQINDPFDTHFRAPGILANAGVELSIGLRLGAWSAANQRNLPYHAAHAIPVGLQRKHALASITLNPANLLGIEDRLGSLEKGKEATFIACNGDIFDLRTTVEHMRISGKEVDLSSRHTRLYKKYQKRPKKGN